MDSNKLRNGLIAGFVATVVLSVLLVMKNAMGVMPELDPVLMLAGMMGMAAVMGWIGHFMIGTVLWGGIFGLANDSIPGGSNVMKGIVLGIGAWLVMMIVVMPMAGAGFFGMNLGIMSPVMTLVMHIVYGAVLGGVYQALVNRSGSAAPVAGG